MKKVSVFLFLLNTLCSFGHSNYLVDTAWVFTTKFDSLFYITHAKNDFVNFQFSDPSFEKKILEKGIISDLFKLEDLGKKNDTIDFDIENNAGQVETYYVIRKVKVDHQLRIFCTACKNNSKYPVSIFSNYPSTWNSHTYTIAKATDSISSVNVEKIIILGDIPSIKVFSYPKLKVLYLSDAFHQINFPQMPDLEEIHYENVEGVHKMTYKRIEEILNLKKLKVFDVITPEPINYIPEKISDLPELKEIVLFGQLFLPVGILQKKGKIHVNTNASIPELCNLYFLGMLNFQDSTVKMDHYMRLDTLVNPQLNFNVPFDGRYESKYKNGKVLAKGNFNQGKPDGKWLFNYSTGKIQSVRYYNKGVEEGHWLMLSETGDTILYLEFIKGVLKRSKSFYYGRYDYENVGDIDTEIKTLEISRNDSLIQYDLKMYDNHRRLIVQSLIYSKKELINVSPAIPIVVDFSGFSSCLNTYECIDDITGSYVQRDSSGYIKCLVEFKNSQISSPFKLFYPNGKTMKETGMYDTDSGSFYMIKSYFPSGKIQEVTRVIKILKDKKESHYGYARDFFNYGEYEEEYIKWDEDGNIIKRYNGLNTLH